MDEKQIDSAIAEASRAAQKAGEFKSETFSAVLLAQLLRGGTNPLGGTAARSPAAGNTLTTSLAKPLSPGEFFAESDWSTEIDKVVLAGYFLERYSALTSYTIQELRSCLMSAKVAIPKNVNLAVFQAVQRGLMMELPGSTRGGKVWQLTQTGERRAEEAARVTASREKPRTPEE